MKYLARFTVLLAIAAIAIPVWAQDIPVARPEKVGMSQERLDRITERMERNIEQGLTAGEVALVARHGKVAYFESRGTSDREAKRPMTEDTIFRIYSMSKPITSVALMSLYEEGKFLLNDPVSKYIPELGELEVMAPEEDVARLGAVFNLPDDPDASANTPAPSPKDMKTEPVEHEMTVRDLLRHTAGFTYGFFGNTPVDKMYQQRGILIADRDLEHMVEKLGTIPLQYQPGTKWHYSIAVDVQGRLIEVLSGQPFDQFLQERIFEPLGMADTGFYVPEEKLSRFSQLYSPADDGGIKVAPPYYSRNFVNQPTFFSGGGGMVSTATDYLRFSQMMLNGGELNGTRILSRKTVELMTTNHLGDLKMSFRSGYGFGLGFAVAEDLGQMGSLGSEGEYNWGGAAGTRFWIDPEEEMIGVYMVQILPHTGLNYGSVFKNLAYQAIDD